MYNSTATFSFICTSITRKYMQKSTYRPSICKEIKPLNIFKLFYIIINYNVQLNQVYWNYDSKAQDECIPNDFRFDAQSIKQVIFLSISVL